MTAPSSIYEQMAREHKARKLANLLYVAGVTAANLADIGDDPDFWSTVAKTHGMHPPSEVTIAEVMRMMAEMETTEQTRTLHEALLKLLADYTAHNSGRGLADSSCLDLVNWSYSWNELQRLRASAREASA